MSTGRCQKTPTRHSFSCAVMFWKGCGWGEGVREDGYEDVCKRGGGEEAVRGDDCEDVVETMMTMA